VLKPTTEVIPYLERQKAAAHFLSYKVMPYKDKVELEFDFEGFEIALRRLGCAQQVEDGKTIKSKADEQLLDRQPVNIHAAYLKLMQDTCELSYQARAHSNNDWKSPINAFYSIIRESFFLTMDVWEAKHSYLSAEEKSKAGWGYLSRPESRDFPTKKAVEGYVNMLRTLASHSVT
jgi:hypothetical protein